VENVEKPFFGALQGTETTKVGEKPLSAHLEGYFSLAVWKGLGTANFFLDSCICSVNNKIQADVEYSTTFLPENKQRRFL